MHLPSKPERGLNPKPDDRIDLEVEFHRIGERRGYIGSAHGLPAYAYVRVSSEAQTEEGQSGLPRQLLHIHELALKGLPEKRIPPLKITWDMVYADEGFSGFEFRNRPALTALLQDIVSAKRSPYILIEHIDRLSRHATWHQGYLLEQIQRANCQALFWRAYSSEIERSVMGVIAEQGMKQEIQRMRAGMVLKAKSGRITARYPRFGYMFVDSKGQPQQKPGKDTHYAPHPEHAPVVQWIYHALNHESKNLGDIATMLNEGSVPCYPGPVLTSRGYGYWSRATLSNMVRNPAYKGEFYAQRYEMRKTGRFNSAGREKLRSTERDREAWIKIDIPALVPPDEWALAQRRLKEIAKGFKRKGIRREWLLSGLVRCARCGYAFNAVVGGTKRTQLRYYACTSRIHSKPRELGIACLKPAYLRADEIEPILWNAVVDLILDPDVIIDTLDESHEQLKAEYRKQQEYLRAAQQKLDAEFKRWNQAYGSGMIELEELRDRRMDIAQRQEAQRIEMDELNGRIDQLQAIEDKADFVREMMALFGQALGETGEEPSFEFKRKVMQMLIDTIWIDDKTLLAKVEGAVSSEVDLSALRAAATNGRETSQGCETTQSNEAGQGGEVTNGVASESSEGQENYIYRARSGR